MSCDQTLNSYIYTYKHHYTSNKQYTYVCMKGGGCTAVYCCRGAIAFVCTSLRESVLCLIYIASVCTSSSFWHFESGRIYIEEEALCSRRTFICFRAFVLFIYMIRRYERFMAYILVVIWYCMTRDGHREPVWCWHHRDPSTRGYEEENTCWFFTCHPKPPKIIKTKNTHIIIFK